MPFTMLLILLSESDVMRVLLSVLAYKQSSSLPLYNPVTSLLIIIVLCLVSRVSINCVELLTSDTV